jgi:hypothetical protein
VTLFLWNNFLSPPFHNLLKLYFLQGFETLFALHTIMSHIITSSKHYDKEFEALIKGHHHQLHMCSI